MTTRPAATEEPPWKPTNSDGRPNLGSYAVAGALDVIKLAHRLHLDHLDGQPPIKPEISYLAKHLMAAVDTVQQRVAGRVDRNAGSHNRAYRAVLAALDAHPVPWGADQDDRNAWWEQLTNRAVMLYEMARDLIHSDVRDT